MYNMRQIRYTGFTPAGPTTATESHSPYPDAVLDANDPIHDLKRLAGISSKNMMQEYKGFPGSNISVTGTEKGELMRQHDIHPGDPAWFKLWFSLPYLTGERPV